MKKEFSDAISFAASVLCHESFDEDAETLATLDSSVDELIAADVEYDEAFGIYRQATERRYVADTVLRHDDPIFIRYRHAIERRRKALLAIQGISP